MYGCQKVYKERVLVRCCDVARPDGGNYLRGKHWRIHCFKYDPEVTGRAALLLTDGRVMHSAGNQRVYLTSGVVVQIRLVYTYT